MIDRRLLVLGGLAGLALPASGSAQPGGPPRPGGNQGGAPAGAGGNPGGGQPGNAGGTLGTRLGNQRTQPRDASRGQDTAQPRAQPPRISAMILSQSYRSSPGLTLANTGSDAALMARTFQQLRFDSVTVQSDGGAPETMARIATYLGTIDTNTIALLYMAGHGVEIGGENLLLLDGASSFLSLQTLVQLLQQRAGVTVLFLDACRNNPFGNVAAAISGRSLTRTMLSQDGNDIRIQTVGMDELRGAPRETLGRLRAFSLQGSQIKIVFSTDPANVAFDGARPGSRHSPFAEALARHLRQPISLDDIVALTTGDVVRATRRMQSPWSQGSIDRPIYLSWRRRRLQASYG
ncbi:MAG TPA: caspase family protein [Allosphingosinicella sp.]|nr:caspase family protein [Allosphingosinicella sp.]